MLNAPEVSRPLTSPNISISTLLDFVNQCFPDILPEVVLKHYGHTARPEGDLGQSALYSTRNKSNRKLGEEYRQLIRAQKGKQEASDNNR